MNRRAHPHEPEHELNLVPYLDIMVNLVMFMLLSMTGFITFQMVNVNMPDLSAEGIGTPPPKPAAENLTLNLSVSTKGFYIAANVGVVSGDQAATDDKSKPPTIPLKPNAKGEMDYDYATLTSKMQELKAKFPATTQYFLAADKAVKYDVIIHTMDATRGDSQHVLFPDVAFAAMM
jgi:biopolymer transport protein ExbD